MFGFKRKINLENVKTFRDAIKVIKTYTYLQEWEKAQSAIESLKENEEKAYNDLQYKIRDDHQEIQKQQKIFRKNIAVIEKVQKNYEIKKIKYERKVDQDRFKVRF